MDEEAIDVRITRLEQDILDLRTKELEALRRTLKDEYLNKYQLMNEYITRKDNENHILRNARERREWPVIVAGVVVSLTSIISLIVEITH
jgi:hypothetical protein